MYDTRLIDIELSLDTILENTTEYDIYRYYIGETFQLGRIMHSPLREDKNASFGIYKGRNNLMYKDLATGSTGNCIQFVAELKQISYREAVVDILSNLNNKLKISTHGISIKEDYENTKTIISIKKKNFTETDDLYWNQYCLFRDDLRHFNVFPIQSYWINEIVKPWAYKWQNPGYAYQVYNKYKLYFPLANKKDKWRTNCTSYDLQGYEQLKYKDDLLIITKSLKDVMVLWKLGYNAVAPQGEGMFIPKEVFTDLKSRFDKLILFYDNDDAGFEGSKKLATKYLLESIYIPDSTTKDISDYTKKYGLECADYLMNTLIEQKDKEITFKEEGYSKEEK